MRVLRSYSERMAGYRRTLEARSTTTCADRLRELARDAIRPVRVWTARNHNTPADALDWLTREGEDDAVVGCAVLHPKTAAPSLQRLADAEEARIGDRYFRHRDLIAHHPNTPEPLRQKLFAAGACRDCSPTCYKWSFYTRRPCRSSYQPAGLFRRTDAERADQQLSWQREDQRFFAAGACHILAYAFAESHPGYRIHALRFPGQRYPVHVFASNGRWAFDHCGWTLDAELRAAYPKAKVLDIEEDLTSFCANNYHRLPEQFFQSPWQRARDYIARYE